MITYLGDFPEDATVRIPVNTFDSNDPSASVTVTNWADSDIKVHKDGSVTQIVTDGATVVIDFDSIAGVHYVAIDTSVHADYTTGAEYAVRVEGITVDGGTLNAWIGCFSIERSGGALAILLARLPTALSGAGNIKADVQEINATTVLGVGTSGNKWRA